MALACDPNFGAVSLLLHFDGTNGSQVFPDSSLNANVMTANGAVALTTANKQFGTASLGNFSTSNYASTPQASSGPLDLGTGDFTFEAWVFPAATNPSSTQCIIFTGNGFSGGFLINDAAGNSLSVSYGNAGANFAHPTPLNISAWNAIAFVRKAGVNALFLNGVSTSTQANAVTLSPPAATLTIGYNPVGGGQAFNGQIDEMRLTKGTALYTPGVNYTPPSAPFLSVACIVTVPNVTGLTRAAAIAALTNAGFQFTITEVYQAHPTVPLGTVISQNPPGGTQFPFGSNHTITISAGAAPVGGFGGDQWGAIGGDINSVATPPIVGQTLAYAQQPENAIIQGSQSVMASMAVGVTLQSTPSTSVPTTPRVGS